MSEVENPTPEPDAADVWYSERQARLNEASARIEAQKLAVSNAYSNLEAQWQEVHRQEEAAHDSLETRDIFSRLQREKMRLEAEAQQLQGGWQSLLNEEQQISRFSSLDYNGLLESSSEPSQMMLRAYRSKLENDPSALRKLQFEHSRALAKNIKPDTAEYFEHLESAMGFTPQERQTDFRSQPNKTRSTKQKDHKLSADEIELSRDFGISPEDYAKAAQHVYGFDPKADDSAQYIDPGEMVDTGKEPAMEVRFEEKPKPEKSYKVDLNSKTDIRLSKEERELCENMAVQINKPLNQVLTDFAREKIALRDGTTHYQTHDEKVRSSMGAKYR